MFVVTDSNLSADTAYSFVVAQEGDTASLFDYVEIRDANTRWMGQIVELSPHIGKAGGPTDPFVIQGCEMVASSYSSQMAEYYKFWKILLLCEITEDGAATLRTRPVPGSVAARMDREATVALLGLPPLGDPTNVIGYLLNADDVPLCVDDKNFTQHVMVNGASGFGKSNVSSNLIQRAAKLGFTVFLHDAKPDYRIMENGNTDPKVERIWPYFEKYDLRPMQPDKLTKIGIYGIGDDDAPGSYDKYDQVFGLNASHISGDDLASLFFTDGTGSDERAYEAIWGAHATLADERSENGRGFTTEDVIEWIRNNTEDSDGSKGGKGSKGSKGGNGDIHPATAAKIYRRYRTIKQRFPWLDSVGKIIGSSTNAFDQDGRRVVERLSVLDLVNGGGIVHIEYPPSDELSYAVIMARFMQLCQTIQSGKNKRAGGIVQFVDEAHRIFTNGSKYSASLASRFTRIMVEGRSKRHGVIISLQNSSEVPAKILNNISTHIVMRQNSLEIARSATETMGREFAARATSLSKGQALCRFPDSPYTILALMAPSPFDLER